jgi:hypothetical protein
MVAVMVVAAIMAMAGLRASPAPLPPWESSGADTEAGAQAIAPAPASAPARTGA